MGGDHREQLAELLRDLRGTGSFATRRTVPAGDLTIEVRNVGPVELPVSAATAKKLRLVARPARYGHGEATVVDRNVRDTWEIPLSRVKIDKRRWNQTLTPLLATVRDDLGLPVTARLRAELHSMLVYEPGQFFAAHQDSEKSDSMVGSLVVMLPSNSAGGDLLIEHRGQSVRYQGSASSLTFVAFYSDTRHEVLPVERGYRVVLTYNLTVIGDTTATRHHGPDIATPVAALLVHHFTHAPEPRWRGDRLALEPPDRLVFLLDHQYTERGLTWSHLKGHDAPRATVIADAAGLAGCDLGLAHAEIQETWDCYDDAPRRRGARRRYWDDEPDTDGDSLELGELLDSSVTITPVVGAPITFDPDVNAAELAVATPSIELTPHDTEYTGYMGNWGNTMDRWYRRAAIVIWPRARTFALEAKADPIAAVHQVLATIDANPDDAAEMVTTLLRFWPDSVRRIDQRTLMPISLGLALELADQDHATALLEPFAIETLAPTDATVVLALAERHGLEWLDRQITTWSRQRHRPAGAMPDRAAWVVSLPDLCTALRNDPHADDTLRTPSARILISHSWTWLDNALEHAAAIPTPSRRDSMLADLAAPLSSVLRSAAIADAFDLREIAVQTVTPRSDDLAVTFAGVVSAATHLSAADLDLAGIATIAHCLAEAMNEVLAQPERAPDDWSITRFTDSGCCQDCADLAAFLQDPDQQQMTWPLAEPRRQHIHHRIDEAELPVTHRTLRQGSPHKLILTKTDDLFRLDAGHRRTARHRLDSAQRLLDRAT
jgi:2OG-Fe(II) oxygenase superfamily